MMILKENSNLVPIQRFGPTLRLKMVIITSNTDLKAQMTFFSLTSLIILEILYMKQ